MDQLCSYNDAIRKKKKLVQAKRKNKLMQCYFEAKELSNPCYKNTKIKKEEKKEKKEKKITQSP